MESRELFSLGKMYPSDFLRPNEQPRCEPVELSLVMDDDNIVRLAQSAPREVMWGKYWYRSSVTETMRIELLDIVNSVLRVMNFNSDDIWCDVASNDGTLLSYVPTKFVKVGIDPADGEIFAAAENHGDLIIQDYFSADVYKKSVLGDQKIKVLTSIAMFYDLDKPEEFIKDVHEVLDDDGLWVMQLSYTPIMIQQCAFDNICHEHKLYLWLDNLRTLLYKGGFSVMDCQLNDINGGSFRLYIMKDKANHSKFGSAPYRDVCNMRVESILALEQYGHFNNPVTWNKFAARIANLKQVVTEFIRHRKDDGKTFWAYGASTKGNTLLQYFGLDNTIIDGIAEKSIEKWGLRTVGTNIPIYPESEMRKANPDYLLILPWHFINEFKCREKEYLAGGGKFIVPCPHFEIISA